MKNSIWKFPSRKKDNSILLTFGSNFKVVAVKNAALPSLRVIPKPPTRGEYSISLT